MVEVGAQGESNEVTPYAPLPLHLCAQRQMLGVWKQNAVQ